MRKLYLIAVGLVPGILAMLSSAGYSQTPPGSTPPQMAKSGAADRDAGSDTSTTPGSAAPNDAVTSSGAGRSVAPNGMNKDSAPKGSTEPQMAKPDAREASRMDSDAPTSALPPPGVTEGADANKP